MPDTSGDAITPHGGRLVQRIAPAVDAPALIDRARGLPRLTVQARDLFDLDLIAIGALSPLEGFMTSNELRSVGERMRLPDGTIFSLPVILSVTPEAAASIAPAGEAALVDSDGGFLGVIEVRDVAQVDLMEVAAAAYGTTDPSHPGVSSWLRRPTWMVGGPVLLVRRPQTHPFGAYDLTPSRTRAAFRERGWRSIVGFQTRNPIHRAHEYLQKAALEVVDGLLVHPLVGETKEDDIPAGVRLRCYEALLDHYYPKSRTLLSVLPAAMRYAGPREAVFHAILRRNYGCTHFIVGRDHAGVGKFYGPYDAQDLLRSFGRDELGIIPLCFDNSFFCRRCESMASDRTCPHPENARLSLSGTRVREMLRAGIVPPPEFTRPEVAQVLMEMYAAEGHAA